MPELPEVESARAVIARAALGRRIVDVDDSDTFVCRPHLPGEIRAALRPPADRGAPARQEHVVRHVSGGRPGARHPPRHVRQDRDRRAGRRRDRRRRLLGARAGARRPPVHPVRAHSTTAARLLLVDPRRLGRVRLDPPVEALGPDAADDHAGPVPRRARRRHGAGQGSPARPGRDRRRRQPAGRPGLWQAKINPRRPRPATCPAPTSTACTAPCAARSAPPTAGGGVHTLKLDAAPPARRRLPPRRRPDGPGHRRRPHHLVVPPRPTRLTVNRPGFRRDSDPW